MGFEALTAELLRRNSHLIGQVGVHAPQLQVILGQLCELRLHLCIGHDDNLDLMTYLYDPKAADDIDHISRAALTHSHFRQHNHWPYTSHDVHSKQECSPLQGFPG